MRDAHRAELRAMIRAYGQLARSAGRDWLLKGILTREQVHSLMRHSLLAIVEELAPQLPSDATLIAARLQETATSWAEWVR